jgi:hypothetical protein
MRRLDAKDGPVGTDETRLLGLAADGLDQFRRSVEAGSHLSYLLKRVNGPQGLPEKAARQSCT